MIFNNNVLISAITVYQNAVISLSKISEIVIAGVNNWFPYL